MKILALDTSTEWCSVALWRDGEIDAREILAGRRHSELLLDMVDALLRRHDLRPRDLDGIAFGAGPGSFTGLRIACGVTQGLAFGAELPVVGVSTLLAVAESARAGRAVCCLDARMQQVYHAAYVRSGARWDTVYAPGLYAPGETPLPPGDCWTGCGSGFRAYREGLAKRYAERLSAIMPDVYPHARDIVRLAVPEFEEGKARSAEQAVPVYIRDKVALRSDER
jgi:tRNA threonylcarbamoyladenosine biosynthesis protein TsaB